MADISKIGVKGETYDIKDAVAREAMANIKGGLEEIGRVSVTTLNFVEYSYDGPGQYADINTLAGIAHFVEVFRTAEMDMGGLLYPIWRTGVMTDPTSPCKTVAEIASTYDGKGLIIPDNGISNLGNDFTLIFYR